MIPLFVMAFVLATSPVPQRIVSLNLCTDQFVLGLVDRPRIAGVTFLAADPDLSVEHARAAGVPLLQPAAEEVLAVGADLVLASTYGAADTLAILERLGIQVERFAPVTSFAEAHEQIARAGRVLGAEREARQWLEALHGLPPPATIPLHWAAAYGFGGSTPGEGTLEDEVLRRAGFGNAATRLGIRSHGALPLEQLIISAPDVVVLLAYRETTPTLWQLAARHPALERSAWQIVRLPSAWTTCPTPKLVAAVERLAAIGRALEAQP